MKKVVIGAFIFVSFCFISSNLFAAVGLITGERSSSGNGAYSSQTSEKPCPLRGYKRTSCSTGQIPQNYCPENDRYFSSCACDLNFYKYSEKNCDTSKQELSGATCDSGDIKLYKTCRCKSTFKFCQKGFFHSSASCIDEEGTKYAICNEDIPSCESIGHLSTPPAGYKCQEISNEYMKCYIADTCTK